MLVTSDQLCIAFSSSGALLVKERELVHVHVIVRPGCHGPTLRKATHKHLRQLNQRLLIDVAY